jgi:hypothetical protein
MTTTPASPDGEATTLTLDDFEFDTLTLALGYATGAALKGGDRVLAYRFVRLTNTLHRHRPGWVPYEVPQEAK